MSEPDPVDLLIELLRLERDRPPEFQAGGVSARAWAERVRALEEQLAQAHPAIARRLRAPGVR